jgi:hypothetical protein
MRCATSGIVSLVFAAVLSAAAQSQESVPSPRFGPTSPELERRDQSVSREDIEILLRADELLADSAAWNRDDDRMCEDDEATGVRSLFCALQRASIDVLGAYNHRRVALQEVRFAIEDATNGFDFAHRLMDYNNLPETKFSDIKDVLDTARERVRSRWQQEK